MRNQRLSIIVVVLSGLALQYGCCMCESSFDDHYTAFGGVVQRVDRVNGRVGSAFLTADGAGVEPVVDQYGDSYDGSGEYYGDEYYGDEYYGDEYYGDGATFDGQSNDDQYNDAQYQPGESEYYDGNTEQPIYDDYSYENYDSSQPLPSASEGSSTRGAVGDLPTPAEAIDGGPPALNDFIPESGAPTLGPPELP